MEEKTRKTLGIYIHIPFCLRKCLYCDFLSAPATEQEGKRYVSALIREIEEESRIYTDYMVETVFLGGGTPSLLFPSDLERILRTVHGCFELDRALEVSMEANPGTVTFEKLLSWKRSGVNRLSIGLQSAQDGELQALGRIHTWKDFTDTYALAAKAGFNNINIDLMSGIPGQTLESYADTLEKVTKLWPMPAHISSYSLIIEEGTPFFENTPELPDEECERKMYRMTDDILSAGGYRQYEISNYALPGYECRHNERYWLRKNYVGFGIGAASMVENERFRNKNDINCYLNCYLPETKGAPKQKNKRALGDEGTVKEVRQRLSEKEQMEEFMFLGLRMTRGVSSREFFNTFGATIDQIYPGIVEDFCEKGLLERKTEPETGDIRIALTRFGIDVSNVVMAQFLLS